MASDTWRFEIAHNDGDASYIGIEEIELRATVGGADQCSGGTASASSEYNATYAAAKAFDDSIGTRWVTAGGQIWAHIQYLFGSSVTVAEYSIIPDSTDYPRAPKSFILEYYDGSDWIPADTRYAETSWSGEREYTVTAPSDKEIYRLRVTETNGSAYVVFQELEMKESLGGADVCILVTNGFAYASSVYINDYTYRAGELFDGANSNWMSKSTSSDDTNPFVAFCFSSVKNIIQYTVMARVSPGDLTTTPKAWSFEKWNGSAWEVLDTQSGQISWSHDEVRTYNIALRVEVNDAVGVAEDVTVIVAEAAVTDLNIDVADTVSVAENISFSFLSIVSINDTLLVGEDVSLGFDSFISVTDSVGITEDVSLSVALAPLGISVVDTVGITEDTSFLLFADLWPSIVDSVAVAEDIVTTGGDLPVSVVDSVSITESISVGFGCFVSVVDSVEVTEELAFSFDSIVSVYDGVGITESINLNVLLHISVYDSVTTTDVPNGVSELANLSVIDSVGVTEDVSMLLGVLISVVDTVEVSEGITSVSGSLPVSVTDAVTINEDIGTILVCLVSVYEEVTLVEDNTEEVADLEITLYEGITVGEYADYILTTGYKIPINDEVNITENLTVVTTDPEEGDVTGTETIAISENVLVSLDDLTVSMVESIGVTDVLTGILCDYLYITGSVLIIDDVLLVTPEFTVTSKPAQILTLFQNVEFNVELL